MLIIDYTTINDSTVFYHVRYYNYYGYEQQHEYDNEHYITYNKTFGGLPLDKEIDPIEIDID